VRQAGYVVREEERVVYNILEGYLMERYHFGNQYVNGVIILK
jgi:hypothetical protein